MNNRIKTVLDYFTRLFSRFAVRIESIPDEPELIGIGVYGVPRDEMAWVRKEIGDAEDSLFSGFGIGLIPMIRSMETTAKHYPSLVAPWVCQPSCGAFQIESVPAYFLAQFMSVQPQRKYNLPGSAPADSTPDEMLLAA